MVEDTKVMGYKKRPTSLRAYVGVGPYFAKSFREISPLFGGFGEISANNFFQNFANLGRNFVKTPRNLGVICPCYSLAEENSLNFANPPPIEGDLRRLMRNLGKFREIFEKFWPFLSEITKEISPRKGRNKG